MQVRLLLRTRKVWGPRSKRRGTSASRIRQGTANRAAGPIILLATAADQVIHGKGSGDLEKKSCHCLMAHETWTVLTSPRSWFQILWVCVSGGSLSRMLDSPGVTRVRSTVHRTVSGWDTDALPHVGMKCPGRGQGICPAGPPRA
jgi:hypothetical protein